MSIRILNVGVGVFSLAFLWAISIVLYIFTRKAKKPVSTIGSGAIALSLLLTSIAVFVPKYSTFSDQEASDFEDALTALATSLGTDWKYIGRATLLILDVVFLMATIGLLFSKYLLRKIVR